MFKVQSPMLKLALGLLSVLWLSHDLKAETVTANKTSLWGVPIPSILWIQHTFACTNVWGTVTCFAFPSNSNKTSGITVVTGTTEPIGIMRAKCYATCSMTYGIHGVCHQHTNRIIYPSNYRPTLPTSVTGYSSSRWLFGARGTNWSQCISKCGDY